MVWLLAFYLIEGFGVSPVMTLCILKDARQTNLDAVAGELVFQGHCCFLALLDRQQCQRSVHGWRKQMLQLIIRIFIV